MKNLTKARKVHKINNLTVRFKPLHGFWHVLAPGGIDLDYFRSEGAAIRYARRNKQFVRRKK